MSKREHRRFTAEQKLEILREADQPGVTVSEVCRRHSLSPSVLYRWRAVAQGGAWLDPAVTARVLAIYRAAPAAGQADRDKDLDTLTSRELEVLVLIGRGKTNGEIAAELFDGEGTVKTHINHLFTKLRLRDRAAAVVFAFDHDLGTHSG